MRRARSLLPLLAALAVAGCMHDEPIPARGFLSPPSAAPGKAAPAQADVEMHAVGPKTYTLRYRAPPSDPYLAPTYVAAPVQPTVYTLDSGDKLRVVVFGQEGITGSYTVDAAGNVSLPLIGSVPARGLTPPSLARSIAEKLKQGYVRDPNVTAEIETYRPFFILGEVTTPGQYAYVPNMTVETAVAIAGGFAPRAYKHVAKLTRQQMRLEVPLNYPVRPGDTIVVKERWF
jgi:polysaccharide export outer membrane protein